MSELCERVKRLNAMLDTDKILSGEFNSNRDIKLYYAINRLPYRLMHSKEGFMHFRISKEDGVFSEDDIRYQPDTVSAYIPPHARVLELGSRTGREPALSRPTPSRFLFLRRRFAPRQTQKRPAESARHPAGLLQSVQLPRQRL